MQEDFALAHSLLKDIADTGSVSSPNYGIRVNVTISQDNLVNSRYSLCGKHGLYYVGKRSKARSKAFQRTNRGQLSTQYKDQL